MVAWQPDMALAAYQRAVTAEPGNVDAHLALGWTYQLLGEEEKALSAYQRALALQPGNPSAHLTMGDAYLALGERDQAIAEYQNAATLDRSSADAFLALGDLYEIDGDLELAEQAYRQAVTVDSSNMLSRIALGQLLQEQEQYDAALLELEKAASLDRGLAWPLVVKGNVYRAQENLPAAQNAYLEAIAAEPGNASGYINLGAVYRLEEDYEAAMAQFEKALTVSPNSSWALETMGYSYWPRLMLEAALDSFSKALALDPTRTSAYGSMAAIYKRWSTPQEMAAHYELLAAQHPDVPWYTGMAAYLYMTLDDVPKAKNLYERLLTFTPQYADAHYRLALLYERGSDARIAMHHWNTYLALAAGSQYGPEAEVHRAALRRVVITSPDDDEKVEGRVAIRGWATIDDFWYYKVEYLDPMSGEWRVIGDLQYQAVSDGLLATWDTTSLPTGDHRLRLVVVNLAGQFLPPYELQVFVEDQS
jgi:tetratricopeptide (TPR) repeat protein